MGAFLKYGKLEAAEPCCCLDPVTQRCRQPTIQFSKKFIFDDIEWADDFLDPGTTSTIEKMDEIGERVYIFLLLVILTFDHIRLLNSIM